MYKEIIDSLKDPVAVINKEGNIILTNKAWKKYTDIANNFVQFLLNAGYIDEYDGIVDVLTGNIPVFSTSNFFFSLTEKQSCSVSINPIVENGKITGATIICENTTSDVNDCLEVHDVLENMIDAFFSLDEFWKFTYINKKAEKLLHVTKEELLGEEIWELFPHTVNTIFEQNCSITMNEKTPIHFEAYYEPLHTWYEVHSYPIKTGGIAVSFKNINDKKVMDEKLLVNAHHDYLTGIPNRLLLYKEIERKMAEGEPFAVYFLDVNNFRHVNDAYGHDVGDNLLLEVSNRLKEELPTNFFISRFGGDEFILCTEYIDDYQVQMDSFHLLTMIEKPFTKQGLPTLNVNASIGVSTFPSDGNSVDSLISKANTAMYEAKKMKTEQWRRYENIMSESYNRRLTIEKSLKEAILTGDYYTVFQPQIDIVQNKIIGVEVLSRYAHPELGPISPEEFISIAEETGQIRMLTEHIINTSLTMYNKWKKQSEFTGNISFNISATLLNDPSFVSFLLYQIEKHSIPRGILEIEITENIQIFSSSIIHNYLHDIREAGILIAIDDFGVGYSNLSYITNLPITKIKIDKFFIDCIGSNTKGEAILQSILVLANNLEIDVIAEGVETKVQIDFLLTNNCTLVQGAFYDMPLTSDQFQSRIHSKCVI